MSADRNNNANKDKKEELSPRAKIIAFVVLGLVVVACVVSVALNGIGGGKSSDKKDSKNSVDGGIEVSDIFE